MRPRGSTLLAALFGAALLLTGCGASPGTAPVTPSDGAAFPVTVRHAFGETTVPAPPQRVVALGMNDLAVAQAVGAPVVGAVRSSGDSGPVLPYLEPLPPEVLAIEPDGTLPLEQIAAFRPDLVLGVSAFQITDRAAYDALSRIAPTVTFAEGLYTSSMQDDARQIGRALGRADAVETLVAEAERRIAETRDGLPGLAGRTYLFGQARGEILPMVVGEQNQSTAFLRSLGLEVPASFRDAPASDALAPGTVGVSYEEVGRLSEADLLLMTFAGAGDRARFEGDELVRRVRAVRQGTYTPVTLDQAIALQAPNVVSVGWLLDGLRPALERVAAG
ncbi:ABC transporter substrate-binding protein [Pseudonocardia tropica]|uniref:ABC transporter substrate-binding protein n=1 Tax=Pseudonocardia tropica TaxID=681289 RepID=A0ABV1JU48_9PSEU